ncbi:MAG: 6,7-dimethyl-8-ribityllumazine synthase [Saprospiraceae bacterium]|nr:6,7-dimethyl-8-ribityllumazine synthase [Saprospiraceae bacterium]MDP4999166.1 6,7-dimethyl-8-ribityllumazine synthase [Saprospiraceae bacterium]
MSSEKGLSAYDEQDLAGAAGLKLGIVVSDWNTEITNALYLGAADTLRKHGVLDADVQLVRVPGTFELPMGAKLLLSQKKLDAVICLGCVIKGETDHDVYINQAVASGLTQLGLLSNTPCIFGVLTTNNEQQALDRAGGRFGNKGVEAAVTALRMALLKKSMATTPNKIGY